MLCSGKVSPPRMTKNVKSCGTFVRKFSDVWKVWDICNSPYQQSRCLHSNAALDNLHCTCCLNTIQEPEVEVFNNNMGWWSKIRWWIPLKAGPVMQPCCRSFLMQLVPNLWHHIYIIICFQNRYWCGRKHFSSKPSLWRAFSSWISPHISGSSWTIFFALTVVGCSLLIVQTITIRHKGSPDIKKR